MSSFSLLKYKLKTPISSRFCARSGGSFIDPLNMFSLLHRFVRHAFVLRNGFIKRKLTIGKLGGGGQHPKAVRVGLKNNNNNSPIALTNAKNSDLFQNLLNSVAGTVREVFITNALKRNSNLVRLFQHRFAHGSRPALGLIGLGLVSQGGQVLREKHEFEEICAEIRNTLRPTKETGLVEEIELEDLEAEPLGPLRYIGKGQCGAVYESKLNGNDVAVKVMFNFQHQSNSSTILRGMMRELVPSRQRVKGFEFGDLRKCAPHPNIVDIKCILTSRNKSLPGAHEHWPQALPQSLNGYGRNMTLYIVMEKYDDNLESYLKNNDLNLRQRVLILSQMLEGVTHLRRQGIAHRDLKADNFLVKHYGYPRVVITDFGMCLASKDYPLHLSYDSYDVEIGGNVALLAPEILCTTPGRGKLLSYQHSDTWAVGAIAYQVFGRENPFYSQLSSKDYKEEELPELENVPGLFQRLVKGLLKKDPHDRMRSDLAANICYVFLWGPRDWLEKGRQAVADFEITQWLMLLTTKAVTSSTDGTEMDVIKTFLQRVTYRDVARAVRFCQEED